MANIKYYKSIEGLRQAIQSETEPEIILDWKYDLLDWESRGEISDWLKDINESFVADRLNSRYCADMERQDRLLAILEVLSFSWSEKDSFLLAGEKKDFSDNFYLTFRVGDAWFRMIRVGGGTFSMGSIESSPIHEVTLSTYYIGQFVVTQRLWKIVMGADPAYFKGDNRPVETVNWNLCQSFIEKLNSLARVCFRLPTEAEWEFAARGGRKSKGHIYSGSDVLDEVGWNEENSSGETHEVGMLLPNELGLYDMSGNVWEWCQDCWGGYSASAQKDPQGASSGSYRVYRGGSWGNSAGSCAVSYRYGYSPGNANYYLGFRLVFASSST